MTKKVRRQLKRQERRLEQEFRLTQEEQEEIDILIEELDGCVFVPTREKDYE